VDLTTVFPLPILWTMFLFFLAEHIPRVKYHVLGFFPFSTKARYFFSKSHALRPPLTPSIARVLIVRYHVLPKRDAMTVKDVAAQSTFPSLSQISLHYVRLPAEEKPCTLSRLTPLFFFFPFPAFLFFVDINYLFPPLLSSRFRPRDNMEFSDRG